MWQLLRGLRWGGIADAGRCLGDRTACRIGGRQRAGSFTEIDPVVRPESCIKLAGGSPAAVSAGAPRSRPRAVRETEPSEWGVESPQVAVRLPGGEPVRRPSVERTLQPREIDNRKVGSAEPLMSRRRQQTASGRTGAMQDARGVWRRACGDSLVRNRRDPSRRPASGEGGPYKPKAKGDRAGRESEGPIVPLTPVEKAGRGKGPCFGQGCGVR